MGLCEASGSKLVVFRLSLWDWAAGVGRVGRLTSLCQADTLLCLAMWALLGAVT